MFRGEDTSSILSIEDPSTVSAGSSTTLSSSSGVPSDALHLLEVPTGEESPPPPQLLGYRGGYEGTYGASYGSYNGDFSGGYENDYIGAFGSGGFGGGELVMMAGGAQIGVESLAQAAVILVIGVAIIISNIIVLATFITMPGKIFNSDTVLA